jgi:hypothetical protein
MRSIIFALAGMFLASTALAQESAPSTCRGLSREQCNLAPGCAWTDHFLIRLPDRTHTCISLCLREPSSGWIKDPDGPGWTEQIIPRGLIP